MLNQFVFNLIQVHTMKGVQINQLAGQRSLKWKAGDYRMEAALAAWAKI